jgi:hypothetical protein
MHVHTVVSIDVMSTRRVTANLPGDLLDAAMEVTGKGITEALTEGLTQVQRRRFYERLVALRWKLTLDIDVDDLRGRRRRHIGMD